MDVARLSTDIETKENLIERAEERLRHIDQALGRLARGNYGTCAECGEGIPVERLIATLRDLLRRLPAETQQPALSWRGPDAAGGR